MKRLFGVVLVALVLLAGVASAQDKPMHYQGGLGFHNSDAPLGGRWWLRRRFASTLERLAAEFALSAERAGDQAARV